MTLNSNDPLGRGVFSARRARRARNGNIDHNTFLEAVGVGEISVDRLDIATDSQMAMLGDAVGRARGRDFQGWAVVTVGEARSHGRRVLESPRLENPYHADIVLPLGGGEDQRDEQKQHVTALAAVASWRSRP